MNIITSKANLEQSFEKLKRDFDFLNDPDSLNSRLLSCKERFSLASLLIERHLNDCTEPEPDDIKDIPAFTQHTNETD